MRGKYGSKLFLKLGTTFFSEVTILLSETLKATTYLSTLGNLFTILSHGLQSGVLIAVLKHGGLQQTPSP